jgi:2-methylcitrate dehydratase PrpD
VHIAEDPEMSAKAPVLRPARVTVRLADGRCASHARDSHRGDFNEPFAESEIRGKFRELAGTVLTAEGVVAAERAVDAAEEWADIRAFADLLRRHTRP